MNVNCWSLMCRPSTPADDKEEEERLGVRSAILGGLPTVQVPSDRILLHWYIDWLIVIGNTIQHALLIHHNKLLMWTNAWRFEMFRKQCECYIDPMKEKGSGDTNTVLTGDGSWRCCKSRAKNGCCLRLDARKSCTSWLPYFKDVKIMPKNCEGSLNPCDV